ncbi:MAG: tetratricopeptide repeat protein [Deltaproteobacteria bacterium]|nr:tetratricopeptide repeat protein [Deltaproteobacteria bacterium]
MLKGLFQSKEDKIRVKVAEHIADGMTHLSQKFYNGAMIEFDKAMELNPEEVYPRLVEELSNAAASGELESALAIGLNLFKKNNSDYELANKLGNYARELKDYKQANGLYKAALKVNKNYEMAFYNLAASQAKVNIFDGAIVSALEKFDTAEGYILPDYFGEENLIERMTAQVEEQKQLNYKDKVQDLTIERDKLIDEEKALEAQGIDNKLKKLKDDLDKVSEDEIIGLFKTEIEGNPENANSHKFNLSLFALKNRKPDEALTAMEGLTSADFETVELLKAIAMDQKGFSDEAIRKLIQMLGKNEYNRYNNVNLGLMYRKAKKKFLATKYLVKTAALLEKSNGIYSMRDLLKLAEETYEQGNLKKALNYFTIASSEVPTPQIWNNIGSINVEMKKYDEAVEAFRSMAELDPKSKAADSKIKEIHDYYVEKGEKLFLDHKFKPAVDYYHKALGVLRLPETLKQTADVYKQLNNSEKEKELLEEWQKMMDEQKQQEQEQHRQKMILKGKTLLKQKNYIKAIETFEAVLRMKVDRKIFMQLAALYKGLKKGNDLAELERRFEKMLLHEEKMRKFEKEEERKSQAEDGGE